MSETQRKILSPATLVPLGVVVGCCLSVIISVVQFHSWIEGKFTALAQDIRDLKTSAHQMNGNRWTSQDMEIYALRMKLNNPTLNVPDVAEIVKRREQTGGKP